MSVMRIQRDRDGRYQYVSGNLNVRQLLTPVFYGRRLAGAFDPLAWLKPQRHPDSSRQRKARQLARDRRVARALKAQYIPLCRVDPTVYVQDFLGNWRPTLIPHRIQNGVRMFAPSQMATVPVRPAFSSGAHYGRTA